jgi:Family of unknown function (DUF6788)
MGNHDKSPPSKAGQMTRIPEDRHVYYQQEYRNCGKQHCHACQDGKKGHGPYWYAYWREDGRLRSGYIGKKHPAPVLLEQSREKVKHE